MYMMDSQLHTDKNSYKQLLSNKQVIAIFFAGLLMLLIAFGADLSVIKNSLTKAMNQDERTTTKPQPKPEATTQSATVPTDSNVQSAVPPVSMKYIIKFQVYGTKEAAERARAELRNKNYWSAYIQEPSGQDT